MTTLITRKCLASGCRVMLNDGLVCTVHQASVPSGVARRLWDAALRATFGGVETPCNYATTNESTPTFLHLLTEEIDRIVSRSPLN